MVSGISTNNLPVIDKLVEESFASGEMEPTGLKEFDYLLGKYWDAAYAEGKEGRTYDTVDSAAQRMLHELQSLFVKAMLKGKSAPSAGIGMVPVANVRRNDSFSSSIHPCDGHTPKVGMTYYSADQLTILLRDKEKYFKEMCYVIAKNEVLIADNITLQAKLDYEIAMHTFTLDGSGHWQRECARLRAKLEQAEKDKAETLLALNRVKLYYGSSQGMGVLNTVIAKYEGKKSWE